MRRGIEEYVKQCPICQKEGETRKKRIIKEVRRLEETWTNVSIDHMTKLPKSRGKDSILIIQDDASGMIYLMPVSEKETAEQV